MIEFDELAGRWRPILDAYEEAGVDLCFEIHPGEDVCDGITYEMFLERTGKHPCCATMIPCTSSRSDGIEAVAIVTPNYMHVPVAEAFLHAGIHVCDKPLTTTLERALRLRDKGRASGLIFAVTYNYTGYPLVRHARAMIESGELGAIRLVQIEYPQGDDGGVKPRCAD